VKGRAIATSIVAAAVLAANAAAGHGAMDQSHPARLTARPGPGGTSCKPGTYTLRLGQWQTAVMKVTSGGAGARPLLLALHGAGGSPDDGLWAFRAALSSPGMVLVAPQAQSRVWNPLYGPDLNTIDRALKRAFARCRVDPRRIAVGGFSDGAGNALTLGLVNGDLFRAVMALAPGALIAEKPAGKPRVFVAHGRSDTTIPIRASDAIVRELRAARYPVTYRKFPGGHEVPDPISKAAVSWFLRG
jgi:phospholipase/carboxylesterase